MKKSLWKDAAIVFILISSFISQAVECSVCGQEFSARQCRTIDLHEESLKKAYQDHIYKYAEHAHQELVGSDDNASAVMDVGQFFDYYNNPVLGKLPQTNDQLQEKVEIAVAATPLQYSVGTKLELSLVRPDILKETASGLLMNYGLMPPDLNVPSSDFQYICHGCYQMPRHLLPANFQLGMKLGQIIDRSDITVVLNDGHASRYDPVLTYLQLFRNKKLVVGLRTYDTPDMAHEEFEHIKKLIGEHFNTGSNLDEELAHIIAEYNLPVFDLGTYILRNLQNVMLSDLALSCMIGKWCPNAAGFAMESPLAYLGELENKDYKKTLKNYSSAFDAAVKELNIDNQNFAELNLLERKGTFGRKFVFNFKRSLVYRQEIVQKICTYYAAVNRGRKESERIPFLIVVDACHGFKQENNMDGKVKENLIQNLLRKKLLEFRLNDVKVSSIGVGAYMTDRARLYAKECNPILEKICIDYVMFPGP
ncbi:hypothetical protein P0136_08135 [Lentisphaerota bacterium ZTH]|nr:hypothetical protein JYG24_00755 [Lentisphaerota bacterium]WET05332.1 hypothetical protein P0136_08135 [Lentisphaerota bacterium ZTH]